MAKREHEHIVTSWAGNLAACRECELTLFMAEIFRTRKKKTIMREAIRKMVFLMRRKKNSYVHIDSTCLTFQFFFCFSARVRNNTKTSIKKSYYEASKQYKRDDEDCFLLHTVDTKRWKIRVVKTKRKQNGEENNLEQTHQVSLLALKIWFERVSSETVKKCWTMDFAFCIQNNFYVIIGSVIDL